MIGSPLDGALRAAFVAHGGRDKHFGVDVWHFIASLGPLKLWRGVRAEAGQDGPVNPIA